MRTTNSFTWTPSKIEPHTRAITKVHCSCRVKGKKVKMITGLKTKCNEEKHYS
jgi:hypothetical protein